MEQTQRDRKSLTRNIALFLLGAIAVAGIVFAYVQYDQKQQYIAQAIEEKRAQEQYVSDAFNRIESNLSKIRQHEGMIQQSMAESESMSNLGPEERIQHEIDMIEQLVEENNNLIANLNKQLDEKDSRLASYDRSVKDLKARIEEYKGVVDVLVAEKEALQRNLDETTLAKNNLEVQVGTLNEEVTLKTTTIEEQNQQLLEKERALHTAYFTVGTYKTLRDRNIVDKEGGFLGINRVKTLTHGADNGQFTEIDYRDVVAIPVDAKRCEIVSGQDPSTYTFQYENGKVESIRIMDPDRFWAKSKYLVVVVRDSNYDELAASR